MHSKIAFFGVRFDPKNYRLKLYLRTFSMDAVNQEKREYPAYETLTKA